MFLRPQCPSFGYGALWALSVTFVLGAFFSSDAAWTGRARFSTQNALWAGETGVPLVNSVSTANTIDIDTATVYQTINGFGGCFNEHGGKALAEVGTVLADSVMRELFDTVQGCNFNICRMPIGASDFSVQTPTLNKWYSLNETANDTNMNNISIERDKVYLIPFIKHAMKYRPGLKLWASPWSPPSWMKINNSYAGANSGFIQNPSLFRAYALYFVKGCRLFRDEGINLFAISPQNEPYTQNPYPCCLWSPTQIRDFIKLYMGPKFTQEQLNCQIWSPTMNNGNFTDFNTWLSDPGSAQYIKAVCFQWEGESAIASVHAAYPDATLYLTETKCGSHENNWAYAENPTFQQMKWYFDRGANGYMQWNMVLDQTGLSAWGWAQCSMVSVDVPNKRITFNPQHYCAKHFSYYVRPGAKKIKTSGSFSNQVGFRNPDGSVVVVANNTGTSAISLGVRLGARMMSIQMPGKSFGTFVFEDSGAVGASRLVTAPAEASRLSVIRTGTRVTLAPQGSNFDLRLYEARGAVRARLCSAESRSLTLETHDLTPGLYVVDGVIDSRRHCSTLAIR